MKKKVLYFVLGLAASSSAFATVPATKTVLQCLDFAEVEAARYSEMSMPAFRENSDMLWTCKYKSEPSRETIQFSDGHGLVGVEVKVINGQCTLLDVYAGQDDEDMDMEETQDMCLENSIVQD